MRLILKKLLSNRQRMPFPAFSPKQQQQQHQKQQPHRHSPPSIVLPSVQQNYFRSKRIFLEYRVRIFNVQYPTTLPLPVTLSLFFFIHLLFFSCVSILGTQTQLYMKSALRQFFSHFSPLVWLQMASIVAALCVIFILFPFFFFPIFSLSV